MWGALSDERTGLSLQLLLAPAKADILGSESLGTHNHISLSQIRNFPFRRLLLLAGLPWRYSTPPPHRILIHKVKVKSQSHIATDGQSISKSLCRASSGAHDQIFIILWQLRSCFWGTLSDERTGLSFVYAAGPRQRSLSQVRVPWISRPYFTVTVLRLPFSSPPTTHRVSVEVFVLSSARVSYLLTNQSQSQSYVTTDGSVGQSVLE
jgi:hypothetical protein